MLPTIGPISTYTLLIDLGIIATLIWLWFQAGVVGRNPRRWLDIGLATVVGGLVGARSAFVLINWAYFATHLGEAFAIWRGGLAWSGAVFGGLVVLGVACYLLHEPFLPLFNAFAPAVLLLSALNWAGCAAAGCAPGLEVPPGTLPIAVFWPDEYGVEALRWPTQLLGVGFSLLALGWWFSRRTAPWPTGFHTILAIGIVAVIGLILSTVRGDDIQQVGTYRLDTVLNGLMLLMAVVGGGLLWSFTRAETAHASSR